MSVFQLRKLLCREKIYGVEILVGATRSNS